MGDGTTFRCRHCGYEYTAYTGIGFLFPEVYEETVREIRKGNFGLPWKELFENTPGAAVNAGMELYVCTGCGLLSAEQNLSVYEPKDPNLSKIHTTRFAAAYPAVGGEYVTPHELERDYLLVQAFPHKCLECGERMRRYTANEIPECPKCRQERMEPSGEILWD